MAKSIKFLAAADHPDDDDHGDIVLACAHKALNEKGGIRMNAQISRLLINTSVAAIAASFHSVALAETSPPAPAAAETQAGASAAPAALEEVVVTAQRREQRLQDVPVAVTVVSGKALAQQNITSLEAVSVRLPAVKIVSGPLTDYLNIRGVGSGQNAGFEQSVATFVDGLYRGRSKATRAALFDVDQVEVLKGPQTTFFGNNAIAGALNITTRKPGREFESNALASYDFAYGEYTVQGGVTAPLTDTLSLRVAAQASGQNGYIDDRTTGNDGPRQRDLLGRVALRWEPTDNWRSDLRIDVGHQRSHDALAAIVLNCPTSLAGPFDQSCPLFLKDNGAAVGTTPYYHSYSPPTFVNYDFHEGELTNSIDLGGPTLSTITGYFHHHYDSLIQLIPVSTPAVGGSSQAPSPYEETIRQVSQEIRLQSRAGGVFEWMVGGYFAHLSTDLSSKFGAFFLPFGAFNPLGTTTADTPVAGVNDQTYRDRTLSAFAAATLRPVDHLRINFGLRYTNVHKHATRAESFGAAPGGDFSLYTPFDPVTQAVFAQILASDMGDFPNPDRTDHKVMPSVGIQYDVTPGVMAYATYTNGFKAGGFSAANTINTFGPETVNAYEVGLKSTILGGRLMANLDVFRSDYSNLQETTITFNPLPVSGVANAARARAQGVEASASFRATPNLTFSTELTYLDSKYLSYPNGVCTMAALAATPSGCAQDMSGKRRPYSPKFSGNFGADLTIPTGDETEVHVNPLVYFSTSYFTSATADPLLAQDGYAKVDLRISYGPSNDRWSVALVAKNLADTKTSSYRNPLTGGNGSVYALPDPPRSVALQFSFKH
jgi:outer membrane receptor protein involved in Fe transport